MKTIISTIALLFLTSLIVNAQDWKPDTIWISETGQFNGASYSFDDDSEAFPFVGFQIDSKAVTIAFALQLGETVVWMDANGKKASAEVDGYEYERNAFNSIGRINESNGNLFRGLHYKNQTLERMSDTSVVSPLKIRLDKVFAVEGIMIEEAEYILAINKPKNRVEGFGDKDSRELYVLEFDGRCLVAVKEMATEDEIKVSYKKVDGVPVADKVSGELSGTVVVIGTPYDYMKSAK